MCVLMIRFSFFMNRTPHIYSYCGSYVRHEMYFLLLLRLSNWLIFMYALHFSLLLWYRNAKLKLWLIARRHHIIQFMLLPFINDEIWFIRKYNEPSSMIVINCELLQLMNQSLGIYSGILVTKYTTVVISI